MSLTASEQTEFRRQIRLAPLPLIAARVKRARKALGLTHDEFGERCGMTRQQLIGYEKARHRPKLEQLIRVAEAAEREVEWFLDPEIDPSPFPDDEDGDRRRAA